MAVSVHWGWKWIRNPPASARSSRLIHLAEAVLGDDADGDHRAALAGDLADGLEHPVVGALAARRLVVLPVAVQAGEEQVHVLEARPVPLEEPEVGVHGDVEPPRLGKVDDVADVLADHRLAPREAETLHAEAGQPVEEHLDLRERKVRGIEERRVAVAAPEVAAVGDGEGGRERAGHAVQGPREQAPPEGDRHVDPRVKSH